MRRERETESNENTVNRVRRRPTLRERHALRAESLCDVDTIEAWATGSRPVREVSAARLEAAARKLGIDLNEAVEVGL